MGPSKTEQTLELIREAGILRPRDLDAHGIPREYLARLHRRGLVKRIDRGLYVLPDAEPDAYHSLAQVAKRVPHGVICLLSALRFHELTTQSPFQVWIAVDVKSRQPKQNVVPMRVVRFSGKALHAGIEEHTIEGVTVRIYSAAKTVVDCFKYRNKIGLDVALEALRDCCRQRKCGNNELWRYAQICRVANVMRPYLEAVE